MDADVAVVTSIALDHTDWLGPDRESIGREKAGIFRAGKPAVVGSRICRSPSRKWLAKGALLQRRGVDWRYEVEGETWSFRDTAGALSHLPLPQVPLQNAATAVAALRASGLAVDDAILRAGIRDAMLPGRFQIISDAPRVILDVAHNPHAAAYLAGRLKTLAKTGRVLAVIGMLHDKDIAGTLANLAPEVDAVLRAAGRPARRRQSSWWNICAAVQSIAAWRRRGVRPWLTLKWKIPCWCVVRFTP